MCICDIWKNAQISYRKGVNSSAAASTAVSTRSSWKKAAPAPQHLPWLEPHNYLSKRGKAWRMWHLIIRDVEVLRTFSINYQVKQHLSTHPTPPLCRYSWWSTVNILNIQIESNIVDVKKKHRNPFPLPQYQFTPLNKTVWNNNQQHQQRICKDTNRHQGRTNTGALQHFKGHGDFMQKTQALQHHQLLLPEAMAQMETGAVNWSI